MSMIGGRPASGSTEVGETVAQFPTYEGAQKAVSSLIAGEVPARDIAIVGSGLRSIERITGRLGYASAARSGAVNGLLLGLLFSAIIVIGSPDVPIQAFVGVLFVGIAIGMLLSIVTYSFVRRRRDFASVVQVVADHYEVTVAAGSIHKARGVLGGGTAPVPAAAPRVAPAATPAPAAPADEEPPRYGERVVPDSASTGSENTGSANTGSATTDSAPTATDDDAHAGQSPDRAAAEDSGDRPA